MTGRRRAGARALLAAQATTWRGGAALHAHLLAEALAGAGWRVLSVTFDRGARLPRITRHVRPSEGGGGGAYTEVALPVPGPAHLRALVYWLLGAPIALGAVLIHRYSVALGDGIFYPAPLAAAAAAIGRSPLIVLPLLDAAEVGSAMRGPVGGFRRRFLSGPALIACQTASIEGEIKALLPEARTAVLPNPLPPIETQPLDGRPRALFAARLVAHKRPLLLLDAWKRVVAEEPRAQLTLIGDGGDDPASVQAEVTAELEGSTALAASVDPVGWVQDARARFGEADVFVQPSDREGQSMALLEAAALGRVVVAAAIPPVIELLGTDYPLLFEPGDADALAAALLRAFADEEARAGARRICLAAAEASRPARTAERLEALVRLAAS